MPTRPQVRSAPGSRTKAQVEAQRPSAGARGYGAAWRALRAQQRPTPCVGCGKPWRASFHLDHIVPRARGGLDVALNLAWRCLACHSRKTARLDGRWG